MLQPPLGHAHELEGDRTDDREVEKAGSMAEHMGDSDKDCSSAMPEDGEQGWQARRPFAERMKYKHDSYP